MYRPYDLEAPGLQYTSPLWLQPGIDPPEPQCTDPRSVNAPSNGRMLYTLPRLGQEWQSTTPSTASSRGCIRHRWGLPAECRKGFHEYRHTGNPQKGVKEEKETKLLQGEGYSLLAFFFTRSSLVRITLCERGTVAMGGGQGGGAEEETSELQLCQPKGRWVGFGGIATTI